MVSTRGHQIKSSDISSLGRYPVVSQSEAEVDGYSDWKSPVEDIPVVLFGDHTCVVKLIDYPFVVGADGTKLLKSSSLVAAYLFRAVQFEAYSIVDGEYRRHYGDLADRNVPCPPLEEQRRIAASVDKAMKRVDAIERQFEKLRETAAACFKSVLKATFDAIGRAARPAPPNGGKTNGVDGNGQHGGAGRAALPRMVRLGDVCVVITDGDHLPPPKTSSGIPFLVISDVAAGRLSFENTRFVPRAYFEKIQEGRKPRRGDVLLTVTGSYGIPVEVDVDREFCFQRHIALVRSTKFLPRFLVYMFLSPKSKRYFEHVATGAAQKTVSLSSLRSMTVCCPSVAEQRRLVARLDAAKARCDGIAALAARGLANCARMRKAILAEAFADGR